MSADVAMCSGCFGGRCSRLAPRRLRWRRRTKRRKMFWRRTSAFKDIPASNRKALCGYRVFRGPERPSGWSNAPMRATACGHPRYGGKSLNRSESDNNLCVGDWLFLSPPRFVTCPLRRAGAALLRLQRRRRGARCSAPPFRGSLPGVFGASAGEGRADLNGEDAPACCPH